MPAELPGMISRNEDLNAVTNEVYVGITDGTEQLLINTDGSIFNPTSYADSAVFTQGTDQVTGQGLLTSNFDGGGMSSTTLGDIGMPGMTPDRKAITVLTGGNGNNLVDSLDQGTGTCLRVGGSHQDGREFFTIEGDLINVTGGLFDDVSPDNVDEHDVGAFRMDAARRQLNRIVGSTDANRWEIDASGLGQVDVAAHALTNANALPISKDNAANAEANPIYVYTVNTVTSGNEIHDYDTATVTAASSDTHDYAVTGTTFLWKQAILSSSGPFYFTLSTGEPAGTVDFATFFLNGREGDTQHIEFAVAKEVPAGVAAVARVERFNRHSGTNNEAYTTIIGNDVA